ncbi:hypothetical protein ACFL23_04525 [Patescibacteria group bacterium]
MDRFYYPKPFTGQTDCMIKCAEIIPKDDASEITSGELENGCYYGYISEKKKNTPNNWIHSHYQTKSARWCMPTRSSVKQCDCDKF